MNDIYGILNDGLKIPKEIRSYIRHFKIVDTLLYFESTVGSGDHRLYLPVWDIRKEIIFNCHNSIVGGHFGFLNTYELLARKYYFRNMMKIVKRYTTSCHICQTTKISTVLPNGLLMPLPVPKQGWEQLSLDFILPLPETEAGFNAVLVVIDRLTKRAHFIPTTNEVTGEMTADQFLQNFDKLHGMPKVLVSDRDPRFTNSFWRVIHLKLGTKLHFSTAYHAQTDGQVERVNKVLDQLFRSYCSENFYFWDKFLSMFEFAYNSSYQATIVMFPFYADLGYNPRHPGHISTWLSDLSNSRAE